MSVNDTSNDSNSVTALKHPDVSKKNTEYKNYAMQRRLRSNLQLSSETVEEEGKTVLYYISNPRELQQDHPIWHYFFLATLIFTAFIALFIGPVLFGMLAAVGGIGAPIFLSLVGSGLGVLFGLVIGVVFAVVLIVGLIRAVGWGAEWILDTLWYGGNDLLEITKYQVNAMMNPQ